MKKRLVLRIFILTIGIGMVSCNPYQGASTDGLDLKPSQAEYVLLDAKGKSCKALESGADAAADINELHMNLGKFKIKWSIPKDAAGAIKPGVTLKFIYIRFSPRSSGLSASDSKTLASQDLNCVVMGQGRSSITAEYKSVDAIFNPTGTNPLETTLKEEVLLGDFKPLDANKASSFVGTVDVLGYFLLQGTGDQDVPIVTRSSLKFRFDAVR